MDNGGLTGSEIEKRVSDVRRVISMLNSVLWNKNILYKTKIYIYHVFVQSILLDGAETWTINFQQERKN